MTPRRSSDSDYSQCRSSNAGRSSHMTKVRALFPTFVLSRNSFIRKMQDLAVGTTSGIVACF
ncbi:hypothetical protein TIFTF001_041911 [Ficus carica]|uniref:Uncharacterized protein n=1 Tax=Ficus carica TaxID=3494 RepID=A0AA87ZC77_FICCA|nr:hypothetical protein TIFTF001_041911 [Ficus carica]